VNLALPLLPSDESLVAAGGRDPHGSIVENKDRPAKRLESFIDFVRFCSMASVPISLEQKGSKLTKRGKVIHSPALFVADPGGLTRESRLSRGRRRLRDRLARRGIVPAALALWAEMGRDASAAMPAALITKLVRFATSRPAAGAVPVAVTALAEGVIQMMRLARLKPLVAVAAALILATAGVAVQGRQQPAPQGEPQQRKTAPAPAAGAGGAAVPDLSANRALAREQLALIDQALADLHRLALGGEIRFGDPSFSLWGRRRLEALRTAGAGKAEIVAALEKYVDSMKKEEATAQTMYEKGQTTRVDVYDVQFRRREAEIWLNEEKGR